MAAKPVVYHIPVCPFSQRLEVLLNLKSAPDAVSFSVVDITRPRDPELLLKTRGTTALPIMELPDGRIIKESLVILRYLDEIFPEHPVAAADPYGRACENMLIAMEAEFTATGYRFVMNQDREAQARFADAMDRQWHKLEDFLAWQQRRAPWLLDRFGLAETVFTPLFMRFWFLEYYEGYELPAGTTRTQAWREACLAHPAAQQVSKEEIVKLYYDYALGAGNGALPPGRNKSSFVFEPHWHQRPWPPRDKWVPVTDVELGLA
jgi:glutathione S-transferase